MLTIQHIDNKAQFYRRKARNDLYFASYLPNTKIARVEGYLLTTDEKYKIKL